MPEIDPSHELRVYVEYLKIPKEHCPPNYYFLLAIPGTVRDAKSIDRAAKRRSDELRRGLPVELHSAGRKILKRIARARICLLDADAKAAYDASIELKTRTGRGSKTKEVETLRDSKPAQEPPQPLPASVPGPQSTSPQRSPPSQIPSPQGPLPKMEEFDDLLSGIPDVEPVSKLPSLGPGTKPKPRTFKPKKSKKAFPVAYAAVGGIAIISVVVTAIFWVFSGAPDPSQPTIPKLPLATRINDATNFAEYAIGDGVFSLGADLPIPVDKPIPVFLAGDYSKVSVLFEMKFNGHLQEGGFFNVSGRPVQPHLYVDNSRVLDLDQEHSILRVLRPGKASFVVHFDGQEIRLPFLVTQLALPRGFGKKQVIELLGFADKKEMKYDDAGGGTTEHWYYDDYPTVVFLPDRSKIKHLAPVLEHQVDLPVSVPKVALSAIAAPIPTLPPTPTPKPKPEPEPEPEPVEPLPTEVALPSLRGPESILSDKVEAPVDLGAIANVDLDKLELTLDQPLVKKKNEGVRFEISRVPEVEGNPLWEIRLRSAPKEATDEKSVLDDVGAGIDELVGKVTVEDSRLKFAWAPTKHPGFADQLRNCVLILDSAPMSHRIALRPSRLVKPVLIDFDENTQVVEIGQDSLPPLDSTFLEITALENFGVAVERQSTDGVVLFNKTVKIRLTDWERPAEFRIKYGGSRSKPSVIISAHYQLDRKWQRLTIKEVDGGLVALARALSRSEADLRDGQAALSSLPSKIASLDGAISRSAGGNTADLQRQQRILKRQLSKAKGMVRRASKLIPELKAKIPLLEKLAALGNQMHKKARIQFRVAIRTEKGNLDLLRTSDYVNENEGVNKNKGRETFK